jgi:hypothetical protein
MAANQLCGGRLLNLRMDKPRISLRRILLLLLPVAAVAAFIFGVAIPSQMAWKSARTLSDALTDARSVTLVEFQQEMFGLELVFSRVPASREQIVALRTATGAWMAPIPHRSTTCYQPHHRVEIIRADGSEFRFEVCFQCQKFVMGRLGATLPESWREPLADFFTAAGMPPRKDYSELEKNHPDYHLVEEAWRDMEKQAEQFAKGQK